MVEEQRDDVGDPAVEGAGDAAHQRDGGVLLRGEARHCVRGRGADSKFDLPCGIRGKERRSGGCGGLIASPDWEAEVEEIGKGSRRPREETRGGQGGAMAGRGEHRCLSS